MRTYIVRGTPGVKAWCTRCFARNGGRDGSCFTEPCFPSE